MATVASQSRAFLTSEFWQLSWSASVQRAGIYDPKDTGSRARFRQELIDFAETALIAEYSDGIQEESRHVANIQSLVDHGSLIGQSVLGPEGYRWGVAQKLLNLQLKYLWCAGWIPMPPHCPIDRVVILKTALSVKPPAWTKIRTAEEYQTIVRAIRAEAVAAELTIAEWELRTYSLEMASGR